MKQKPYLAVFVRADGTMFRVGLCADSYLLAVERARHLRLDSKSGPLRVVTVKGNPTADETRGITWLA